MVSLITIGWVVIIVKRFCFLLILRVIRNFLLDFEPRPVKSRILSKIFRVGIQPQRRSAAEPQPKPEMAAKDRKDRKGEKRRSKNPERQPRKIRTTQEMPTRGLRRIRGKLHIACAQEMLFRLRDSYR